MTTTPTLKETSFYVTSIPPDKTGAQHYFTMVFILFNTRLCFFSTNFSKYQLEPGSALAGPSGPSAVAVLEQVQPSTGGAAGEEKGSEAAGGKSKTRSFQCGQK